MPEIPAFPLQWPLGYPRTVSSKRSAFRTTFADARDGLRYELEQLKATDVILSTNIPHRKDGFPYANYKEPDDQGVAVYFTWRGEQRVLACDKWDRIGDNMQALRKTVEAIRGLDRWGASDIITRTFSGFKALPQQASGESWWVVLGVPSNANAHQIREAFRGQAMFLHPDNGGDREAWDRLTNARDQGLEALNNNKP